MILHLDHPMLIEVAGPDSGKIVHNLTTNQVQTLSPSSSIESFVTDVRGWVVAHGLVYRSEPDRWWIVGQHPNCSGVASHIDRYIVREDACVIDQSPRIQLDLVLNDSTILLYPDNSLRIPFIAMGLAACLQLTFEPSPIELVDCETTDWDRIRIPRGWPVMRYDIWEKCIPQELDRTAEAINFNKGCYLGQETIARLDALGQIQKKLSVLRIDSSNIQPLTPVLAGGKQVGHVTSSVDQDGCSLSLAVLRRGYFEPGTQLTCADALAVVVPALKS